MAKKPTYEELEQRVKELEKKAGNGSRAKKALRDSEKQLRSIFDNVSVGLALVDKNGCVITANEADCRFLGYTNKEIVGMHYSEFTYPEDLHTDVDLYDAVVKGKRNSYMLEKRYVRKDGKIVYGRLNVSLIRNNDGNPQYTLIVCEDITDRKQAEDALRDSKELFEKTFDSQRDAILILDAGLPPTIRDHNAAASEIFGYSRQEILGRTVSFLHIDETTLKEFQDHLYPTIAEYGFLKSLEFRMQRKDGTIFPTEHTVSPLKDNGGRCIGWVSVIRDITERKQAEDALRKREAELRAQSKHLKESNIALKILLEQRQQDKADLEENVLSNVRQLVSPHIERLKKSRLDPDQRSLVSTVESNLDDIVSPFVSKLSSSFFNLTPMEIRIAGLIKEGRTNKEIGELLCISLNTVKVHRYNLRSKLALKKKKINLRSHLLSLA